MGSDGKVPRLGSLVRLLLGLVRSKVHPGAKGGTAAVSPVPPPVAPGHSKEPVRPVDPWTEVSPEAFESLLQILEQRIDRLWTVKVSTAAEANRILESIAVVSRSLISLSVQLRDLYDEYGVSQDDALDIVVLRRVRDAEEDEDDWSTPGSGMGGMLN